MIYQKSKVLGVLSFLHGTLLFAPLYLIVGSLAGLQGWKLFRISIMAAGVLVPMVLSYILLRKVRYMATYLILAFLCTGIFAVGGFYYGDYFHYGNVILGVLNGFVSLIIFLIRNYCKVEHNKMREEFYSVHGEEEPFLLEPWEIESFLSVPSPIHWGWFLILYVFALICRLHYGIYEIFFILVADVFICFIYGYMETFHSYLKRNHRVASMPLGTMKKVHKQILVVGLLAIMLFLLPAVIYHKEPLENIKLENKTSIAYSVPQENRDYELWHMELDTEMPLLIREYSQHESPQWIWKILTLLMGIIGIVVGILLIYGIVSAIRKMGQLYQMEDEDEVISLEEVSEEKVSLLSGKVLRENLSDRAKIRKKYRKIIRKGTKGQPKKWATPEELEREAGITEEEAYKGLHEEYERARYDH